MRDSVDTPVGILYGLILGMTNDHVTYLFMFFVSLPISALQYKVDIIATYLLISSKQHRGCCFAGIKVTGVRNKEHNTLFCQYFIYFTQTNKRVWISQEHLKIHSQDNHHCLSRFITKQNILYFQKYIQNSSKISFLHLCHNNSKNTLL